MPEPVPQPVILCIDDYLAAVIVRKLLLEQAGYQVVVANSGEEGLEVVKTQHVDLVLSDHFLQGKTGAQVAREMKTMKPELPIVLLSGAIERPEDSDYADAYISKLEGRQVLMDTIAQLLEDRDFRCQAS